MHNYMELVMHNYMERKCVSLCRVGLIFIANSLFSAVSNRTKDFLKTIVWILLSIIQCVVI